MRIAIVAAVMIVAAACPVQAQAPAALVEEVTGTAAGVEAMDYVQAGKVIALAGSDTMVLSYLRSCWRETIAGGTVTVGSEQSAVAGGRVRREKVPCDNKLALSSDQASKSGVMVFRAPPKPARGESEPQLTLYGLSPVVDLKGGGVLVIERLDQPGERHQIEIGGAQLFRGAFYDFAKAGTALAAGGVYRATAGNRSIVFKVDAFASPGQGPVIGRLLRFAAS